MESERRSSNAPWRFSLLISVIVINICLPSLVLSYGTLLIHSVDRGEVPWSSLITPAVFMLVSCITQCWCRDATDSWGGNIGYRVMAALGLFLIFIGVLTCAFTPINFHALFYGVLGGFGSTLIAAQVEAVIFDTYDTRIGIVRCLCFVGQAIGQFMFPHILTSIINTYGLPMTYLLLSGLMLQTLPAILFLKIEGVVRQDKYTRYSDISKSYAMFNNDSVPIISSNEMQLYDLGSKSWKSPSDDSLYREIDVEVHEDSDYVDLNAPTVTPPPSPEEKRHNIFGVEILPEIPEESEVSSDESEDGGDKISNVNRLSVAIKGFSALGDNFDEYISRQLRKDSVADINDNEYAEIDVVYDNISPMTDIRHEKVFNSFTFRCQSMYFNIKRRMSIPAYRWYRIKRRFLYILYSVNDTFVKPLTRSLSCWRFYPALLLSFAKLSLTAISLPLLPLISLQIRPKISMTEMNFLMSLHGFTWICFLLCTPWLINTSRRNLKYPVVLGLTVSTIALFLVSKSNSHDSFSVGCIVAGFGFGAITSCWETTVQDFVGARKWPKVNSTLDTLSGTLLVIFVTCMSFIAPESKNIQLWFLVLGCILATATITWCIIAIIVLIGASVKKIKFTKSLFS